MKFKYLYTFVLAFTLLLGCVSQFEDFKGDDTRLTSDDVSAVYFFTNTETRLWAPAFWEYFYAQYGYGPTFGSYVSIGHKSHWEQPAILYNANVGWNSGNVWKYYSNYFSYLDLFTKAVQPGEDLENPLMEAVAMILKAAYFSNYTDVFGEIPFSEIGQAGILTPKFDTQKDIYIGIIALLDEAILRIADHPNTGEGVANIESNDVVFRGDLQRWKAYANSLKLRMALRAKGAPGADFADAAITQALKGPFLTESLEVPGDMEVYQGISATAGDIINQYKRSAQRKVSTKLINALQDNNDPRLVKYADPLIGGEITFPGYSANATNKELVDYLLQELNVAGVVYSSSEVGEDLVIDIDQNKYYAGLTPRFVDNMKTYLYFELFSNVGIINEGEHLIGQTKNEMIMPLAEVYFLRAEAALLGFGGDANALYQTGIQASFDDWNVADNGYLASPIATLSGTKEEQLQQIGFQYWLAEYLVDFQGWAVARDFDLKYVTQDIPDIPSIYNTTIPLGVKYPQRLRYGSKAYALNGDNVALAIGRQGPDNMSTQLWFAKGTK